MNCPGCGSPLPPDAPAGLCPACLLRGARAGADDDAEIERSLRAALLEHAPSFDVGRRLGRGATGMVFHARERESGRDVAIKVLGLQLGEDPAFRERMAREARAMERLVHPNIVAVHGHGRAGEHPYLVLELVAGSSLRHALGAVPLDWKRALGIATEICRALEFAHERGIVHRDVKPENVLLDRDGRVKISDFGLAKLVAEPDGHFDLTQTGHALGTLRYMAPEQLERPDRVDARADLYALGVVFHEMLTGEVPMGRFAPPSKKAGIHPRFDEVVLHLLDRDPEQRYASAAEVRNDLEVLAAGGDPRPGDVAGRRRVRRLSWLAVTSLAVALPFAFMCLLYVWAAPVAVHDPEGVTTVEPMSVYGGLICIAFPVALSSLLGFAAVHRIRSRWPQLYGVGAAVTGACLAPLALLNVAVGLALAHALVDIDHGERVPVWAVNLFALACWILNAWWIALRRQRLLAELGDSGAAGRS